MSTRLALLASALVLSGCAIVQTVRPATGLPGPEVCVITNAQVRPSFLATYRKALEAKGYAVRVLGAEAAITDCPITSTYRASWRWDLAMYLVMAEMRVFVDGKERGLAFYDATRGGANPGKFIAADKKIGQLTDQLLPSAAGAAAGTDAPAPAPAPAASAAAPAASTPVDSAPPAARP